MNKIIAPAATAPNSATAASGTALGWFLSLPARLWQSHISHTGLRALLDAGPHLIADTGMAKEDLEEMANAPVWQSPHVPQLRHF